MKLMGTYKPFDILFRKGKGVYLYDDKGDEYLDFVSGIAVNSLGHSHPAIVSTIKAQCENLTHISNLYYNEHQMNLSDLLIEQSDHASVFFCNSGTEAVEGAIKVAKKYGQKKNKNKILYFQNAFHGRSLGALSVTSNNKYKKNFYPLVNNVEEVRLNDKEDFLSKLDETVCGVIIEPIQGEGGINPVDVDFMTFIAKEIKSKDALLIFDEVQTGIGRTGKFFAYQHYPVVPDVIALAKGLGGGVPIGAFIVNDQADVLTPGDHGCTFGGNPLVTAVASEVVKIIKEPSFLEEVHESSNYLRNQLYRLKEKYNIIKKIKGQGLMIGVDVSIDPKKMVKKALEEKLLIINAGANTIRLVPPLIITQDEIDVFIEKFDKTLNSLK